MLPFCRAAAYGKELRVLKNVTDLIELSAAFATFWPP
jgi:hypothetical protein